MTIIEVLEGCIPVGSWWWVEEQNLVRGGPVARRKSWPKSRFVIRGGFPLFERDTLKPIHTGYDIVNKGPDFPGGRMARIGWKPSKEDKEARDWVLDDPE